MLPGLKVHGLDRRKSTVSLVGRLRGDSTVSTVIYGFFSAELRSCAIRVPGMAAFGLRWRRGRDSSDGYVGWHTVHIVRTVLSGFFEIGVHSTDRAVNAARADLSVFFDRAAA